MSFTSALTTVVVWRSKYEQQLRAATTAKGDYQILSFEQQRACPHQQNLVGIFGVNDLQIEGTGAAPSDVISTPSSRSSM